jgi:hypothetical protein
MAHRNARCGTSPECFSSQWLPQFKDWAIGLEFRNIRRLADFFKKTRELYPDSSL